LSIDLHAFVSYVLDVAEPAAGRGVGVVRAQAAGPESLGAHRQVEGDLVVDVRLSLSST
jgi:hypothetical protein